MRNLKHTAIANILDIANIAHRGAMAIAISTTGLAEEDLVVTAGTLTIDKKDQFDYCQAIFNWNQDRRINKRWLDDHLGNVARQLRGRGVRYDAPEEILQGLPPAEAARRLEARLQQAAAEGLVILCSPVSLLAILERSMAFCPPGQDGQPWRLPDFAAVLDLTAVEKAVQSGLCPGATEDLRDFAYRVLEGTSKGVRWSLEHCVAEYGLREKILKDSGSDPAGWPAVVRKCYELWYLWETFLQFVGRP